MINNTLALVRDAQREGIAIAAVNTYTLETTRAIIAAAEREQRPIIVQLGVAALKAAGEGLAVGVLAMARNAAVPVAVHLDHCSDMALIEQCFAWGISSALADGSHLPFDENIIFTQHAVAIATLYGGIIEAELGRLTGTEDGVTVAEHEAALTDPAQAHDFVTRTGTALLAVSVGNVHGFTPQPVTLDFGRLAQVRAAIAAEVPLVLHGASGLPAAAVQQAIRLGVAKINVNTEVRHAFLTALAAWGQGVEGRPDVQRKGDDLLDVLGAAVNVSSAVVAQKIRVFTLRDETNEMVGATC